MFQKILHTLTSRVGIAGLNFLVVVLTAQNLGAAGRGEISLFVANIALVLLFTSILGGTGLAYLSPRTNLYQLILPAYVWAMAVSGLVTLAIFLLGQVPPEYSGHLFGLALLLAFFTINTTVLLGKEKVKTYNYLTFLQSLVTALVLVVGFLLLEVKTIAFYFTALYLAYGLTTLLSFLALLQLKEKPDFSNFTNNLDQLFRLGATAQLSNIITFLNYRLGYYFLNTLSDSKAVGIFSVGVSLSEAIWMIGKSLATVQYAKIINTELAEDAQLLTGQLVRLSFMVTLLAVVVLAMLPAEVFQFIFGKEFGTTNHVIWSLGLGIIATGTGMIFSHYFGGRGQYHINNWAALGGLAVTVPACWLLIPRFGPVGAGVAATLSYLTAFGVLYWKYRQETSFRLRDLFPAKTDLIALKELLEKR